VGVEGLWIGPDTGEREGNGLYPVLSEAEFSAEWVGGDGLAPTEVDLGSLDPGYVISGTPPGSDVDEPILIQARFQATVVVDSTDRVVPSEMKPGFVQVSSEDEPGQYDRISEEAFRERRAADCGSVPWLVPVAVFGVVGGLVVLGALLLYRRTDIAKRRGARKLPPPLPPPPIITPS
jgi:hypothetical protein